MRVNVRCEDKSEVVDNGELQDRSGRGKESESDRGRRLGGKGKGWQSAREAGSGE